jgi:hypothetical protein
MVYRLMLAERAKLPINLMARILAVLYMAFQGLSGGWLESDRHFGARFITYFMADEF